MAGRGRRGGRRRAKVDWMPVEDEVALANLASDGEATLVDSEIEHKGTGVAYSSGALVGLRAWVSVDVAALISSPPHIHCLLLPAGLAIPATSSEANKKNAEKFFWWQKMLSPTGAISATAGTHIYYSEVQIKTARRYDQSDRLLLRVHNTDESSPFGASGFGAALIDVYVRED